MWRSVGEGGWYVWFGGEGGIGSRRGAGYYLLEVKKPRGRFERVEENTSLGVST
jgi:hypothetical protein